MEDTILIHKILIHMLDFPADTVHVSDGFAELDDAAAEYYLKRMHKLMSHNRLTDVAVPPLHEVMLRGKQMIESEEEFKRNAKEMSKKLFALGKRIQDMPNANVYYVDFRHNGVRKIAILKVNYKIMPTTLIEGGNVQVVRRQMMPTSGYTTDEAIIIDVENGYMQMLEKKYTIDGKKQFYLNEQWIHGEVALDDRQKYNTMKRVVNKMDDIYKVGRGMEASALMKNEINGCLETNTPVRPIDIVKKVMAKDMQAEEESLLMMEDMGIDEQDVIKALPSMKSLTRCKILTDTEVEISMPVEDYVRGNTLSKRFLDDGSQEITISGIHEIVVK